MDWTCRVCFLPCQPNNAMRRRCCEKGNMHIDCIGELQLRRCPGCRKDPMEDLLSGMDPCTLRPLEQPEEPFAPPLAALLDGFSYGQPDSQPGKSTAVARANRSLDIWKSMIGRQLHEITQTWRERIEVTKLRVGVTLLDGSHVWCLEDSDGILRDASDLESNVVESLERWNGCWPRGRFVDDPMENFKLDQIVEFTVSFTCCQWTRRYVAVDCTTKPFLTKSKRKDLGIWDCLLCLSGLKLTFLGSPQAKRFVIREKNIGD